MPLAAFDMQHQTFKQISSAHAWVPASPTSLSAGWQLTGLAKLQAKGISTCVPYAFPQPFPNAKSQAANEGCKLAFNTCEQSELQMLGSPLPPQT